MALRMAERCKKPLDAIKRKVDPLRMQRQQSGGNGADRRRLGTLNAHAGAAEGTGSAAGGASKPWRGCGELAAGAFMNSRHSRAMVARSS